MAQPLVCAVCLTKDRPALLQRAFRCFRAQIYENKLMLVLNTGSATGLAAAEDGVILIDRPAANGRTIGNLRNIANAYKSGADIIMHWDDDDWSAPTRMAEQVALLQASGAAAVGYNEMLFLYRLYTDPSVGQAWLYRHPRATYCIGTSLCYWRKTWEAKPFPNLHAGEDTEWARDLFTAAQSAVFPMGAVAMVAEIHGRNTTAHVQPGKSEWKRVREWDDRLRSIMTI